MSQDTLYTLPQLEIINFMMHGGQLWYYPRQIAAKTAYSDTEVTQVLHELYQMDVTKWAYSQSLHIVTDNGLVHCSQRLRDTSSEFFREYVQQDKMYRLTKEQDKLKLILRDWSMYAKQ